MAALACLATEAAVAEDRSVWGMRVGVAQDSFPLAFDLTDIEQLLSN